MMAKDKTAAEAVTDRTGGDAAYTMAELRTTSVRLCRAVPTKETYVARNGRRMAVNRLAEYFETAGAGCLEVPDWIRLAKAAILREKGEPLLRAVEEWCGKYAWLHGRKAVEEYAIEAVMLGSYAHWDGFQTTFEAPWDGAERRQA